MTEDQEMMLGRVKMYAQSSLSEELLDVEFQVLKDWIDGVLITTIRGEVLGNHADPQRIRVPATWWQHFKEDVMPAWFTRWFPVEHRVIQVDMVALYPELTKRLLGEDPVVRQKVSTFEYDDSQKR